MNETYTQEEIQSKINVLATEIDSLKRSRSDINSNIRQRTKQIAYWEEFDTSQYKAF